MTDTKLPVDAAIVAADRMLQLVAENDKLKEQLAEHEVLFAYAKQRDDFLEQLLEGLGHQLPDNTPRTVEAIVDEVARVYLALDAHEDASTPAFDEIAKLCGCPEWEYPGQVVRDVMHVIAERDRLTVRRDELLQTIARLSQTVPFPEEWKNWESQRAKMLAEVGTLRHQIVELMGSKDGAYIERDRCVAAIAALATRLGWSAWIGKHVGEQWDDEWRNIVFINLPFGQVSWHIRDNELPWFAFLPSVPERTWDGHTTEQKYERLSHLADSVAPYEQKPGCPDCGSNMDRVIRKAAEEALQPDHPTSIAYHGVYAIMGNDGEPEARRALYWKLLEAAKLLKGIADRQGGPTLGGEDLSPDPEVRRAQIEAVVMGEPQPELSCNCSAKYIELATGVHAKYCVRAGQPLDDGRRRWRCEPCDLTFRRAVDEPGEVDACIQCGRPTSAVAS